MWRFVFFRTPRILILLFSYSLVLLFYVGAAAWGDCEEGLKLYAEKQFDQAIEVAYAKLRELSLSPDERMCACKVLGISYYAKGDLYKDSVEFYMKQIIQLNPQYVFDPDDYWPPFCRDLIYKYQREWRKANPYLPSKTTTLAILPFENRSVADRMELDPLREGLADMLITDLSQVINIKIVERERLQSLLSEMGLGQSMIVDEKTAVEVGKLEGAQLILFGSFLKLDKKHVRIDARIIKTETSELVKAEKAEGDPKELLRLINRLALKVAQQLIVAVSVTERREVVEFTERSWDAVLLYSEGLRLQDRGEYKKAYKKFEEALKIDPGFVEVEKKLHNLQPLVK